MKRLIAVVTLIFAILLSAGSVWACGADWYFQNTNANISNIWFKGSNSAGFKEKYKGQEDVYGVSGWNEYQWGNTGASHFQVHSIDKHDDLDRPRGNKQLPIDQYYANELNYLHLDIKNGNYNDNPGFKTPSKFEVYVASKFTWGGYEKTSTKNPWTLGSYLDFYYLDAANKGDARDWVFMANDRVRLGEITYNGVTYYFDIVSDMSKNKATKLTGTIYNDAIDSSGLANGTELWGWEIKKCAEVHWKFDLIVTAQKYTPPTTPPVPLPGAVWLMSTGLAGLVAVRRKNKK